MRGQRTNYRTKERQHTLRAPFVVPCATSAPSSCSSISLNMGASSNSSFRFETGSSLLVCCFWASFSFFLVTVFTPVLTCVSGYCDCTRSRCEIRPPLCVETAATVPGPFRPSASETRSVRPWSSILQMMLAGAGSQSHYSHRPRVAPGNSQEGAGFVAWWGMLAAM
jgi:hypothetical protein